MKGFEGPKNSPENEILTERIKRDLREAGLTLPSLESPHTNTPNTLKNDGFNDLEKSVSLPEDTIRQAFQKLETIKKRERETASTTTRPTKNKFDARESTKRVVSVEQKGVLRSINSFIEKRPGLRRLAWPLIAILLTAELGRNVDVTSIKRQATSLAGKLTDDASKKLVDIGLTEKIPINFPENKGLENRLIEEVGRMEVINLETGYSLPSADKRLEGIKASNEVKTENFEQTIFSNEQVERIMEDTLPHGLNNVSSVAYFNIEKPIPQIYNIPGLKTGGEADRESRQIRMFRNRELKNSPEYRDFLINNLLLHEVGHLGDWMSNDHLTIDEKIELYQSVIDRVQSPDRFKSGYVEKINNLDPKINLSLKSTEYFAEIFQAYLSPDRFMLPRADAEIISRLIKKIDPNFKRGEAIKKRDQIIGLDTSNFGGDVASANLNKERAREKSYWDENLRDYVRRTQPEKTEDELDAERNDWANKRVERFKINHSRYIN